MLREKPGIAPPIGSGVISRDLRESVPAEEVASLPVYLYWPISGVTLAE
jgi:hypothetical protein